MKKAIKTITIMLLVASIVFTFTGCGQYINSDKIARLTFEKIMLSLDNDDVTANRVIAEVKNYIQNTSSIDPDAQKVFWSTGHSRGAAIANLLVVNYEESSATSSFTYTFYLIARNDFKRL